MPWCSSEGCRPGGIRTPNTRFWRPLLYRWSYWPRTALPSDLPFLVVGVLPAPGAELAQLELVLALTPVLGRGVVPALTHRTLQRDDAPVSLRHDFLFLANGKEGKATSGSPPLPDPSPRRPGPAILPLLEHLGHDPGAHRPATLTDGEPELLLHGDGGDQLHLDRDVVPRHHHLHVVRELHRPGHVGGAEVELRPVALEERGVTPALFLGQHVDLGLELGVRGDAARLGQHLPALHVLALEAAEQRSDVVAGDALVEQLPEHLHPGHHGLGGGPQTDDLHFLANLDLPALHAAGGHGAAAGDRENVLHRHQERLV